MFNGPNKILDLASAWSWEYNIVFFIHTTLTLHNLCKNLSLTLEHANFFVFFFLSFLRFVDESGVSVFLIYVL